MGIAYKLVKKRVINGVAHYYPLYVNRNIEYVIGEKYIAAEGERKENGKVKSSLGDLAFRPGIHLSDIPLSDHIGKKGDDGQLLRREDNVYLECEYSDEIDYQLEVNANGINPNTGKLNKNLACLRHIPTNGFYFYQTNAQAKANWLITGWIIPIRELTDEEEAEICRKHGFEPQRKAG